MHLTAIEAEPFMQFVRGRRSVRRYDGRPVEPPLLESMLNAASWAPSAHNRQPWRYCVIYTAGVKERLSRQMGMQWRSDLSRDGVNREEIDRRVAISHERLTTAGAIIVPSVTMEDMDQYPDDKRATAEWMMAVQSVSLSCQNLLLAAHELGLGACWMCAPLFVPELVRRELLLPEHWHPQALITIGYPLPGHSAADKTKERKCLEEWVVWR